MIDLSELNQIEIGEVNDFALEFYFNKFGENFETHECFKALLSILYNKSNYVARSSFPLNDTHSLFDGGKCSLISLNYSEKMFLVWIYSFGYHSDFQYRHLIVSLSVDNDIIFDESTMFVSFSMRRLSRIVEIYQARAMCDVLDESVVWRSNGADANFWKLQLSLHHASRVFMLTVRYNLFVDVCLFLNLDSHCSVFDRGKDMNLSKWVSYYATIDSKFGRRAKVGFTDFLLIMLTTLGDNGDSNTLLVKRIGNFTNSSLIFLCMQISGIQYAYKHLFGYEWVQFNMFDQRPTKCREAFSLMKLRCGLFVGIAVRRVSSRLRADPCYSHYTQHELYGYIHLWSTTSRGNCFFFLYFVYTCYLFDRGKGFDGYIFMDYNSETSIYEFVLDHGYQLELLHAALTMFLFVQLSVEAENSGPYLGFPWFPSEVCGRLVTHKIILLQVPLSPCSSLHQFFPTWYFTRCCKGLTIFSILDSSEYYLPIYPAIWKFASNGDALLNEVLVFTHIMVRFVDSRALEV
ncbi:hypothetical protein MKX03_029579 [Papaver bracteatum]|nr:hypothetical protein MKX03_029579 [Papaver bracteatum]